MNSYESALAAIVGCAASIEKEHPQLSATLGWAIQNIKEEHANLLMRAHNAETIVRLQTILQPNNP